MKTKSVKDPVEISDGERILVMRYWARPYSRKVLQIAEWLRDLGPSPGLLKDWNRGKISWREYVDRYKQEMFEHRSEIKELASRAKSKTITLLCKEPEDDPHCHRHLLKEMIDQASRAS